ncbi:MAG: hypothetical protein KKA84_11985 [Bacteroidetes bacterium]|nr:hypothetical protein [Bacteroidota bacterium]
MAQKTARFILLEWLRSKKGRLIRTHNIEDEVKRYGVLAYNKTHNGSSYSRAFRVIKNDVALMRSHGFEIQQSNDPDSIEGTWLVT